MTLGTDLSKSKLAKSESTGLSVTAQDYGIIFFIIDWSHQWRPLYILSPWAQRNFPNLVESGK